MGQAKRRGTFEQRYAQANARRNAELADRLKYFPPVMADAPKAAVVGASHHHFARMAALAGMVSIAMHTPHRIIRGEPWP